MTLVRLEAVRIVYPKQSEPALHIERLTLKRGERVALIGATGAGKTTLLRLLDGRLRGWSGTVDVLGHRLDPRRRPSRQLRRRIGFIFQDFALIERMSVYDNVLNGRLGHAPTLASLFGRFEPQDEAAVAAALVETGLAEFTQRRVESLSGGQRQRVAIARCLAQAPDLFLADEPISNLDPSRAEDIVARLVEVCDRRGVALIISSHQPRVIRRHVGRVLALDRGRIVFDGPPQRLDDVLPFIYPGRDKGRAA